MTSTSRLKAYNISVTFNNMPRTSPQTRRHRHYKNGKRKSKHGKSSRKRARYEHSSSEESISPETVTQVSSRRQRRSVSSCSSPWQTRSPERITLRRHRSRSLSSSPRRVHASPERIHSRRRRRTRSSSGSSQHPRTKITRNEEYASFRDNDKTYPAYKVLCVSALHTKASDEMIKDALYSEYKRFGELTVRISRDLDERVAYVCFKNCDDARYARNTKPRVIIYDKIALVEPVYESGSHNTSERYRARSRQRSVSYSPPSYDRYYKQSPVAEIYRTERIYERIGLSYGPPLPIPSRDFHRSLPPIPHPEFLARPPLHPALPPPPPHLPPPLHLYAPPRPFLAFKPFHPQFLDKFEKKDKFPNYLHHVPPEDDPLATRTLFIGNLELSITEDDLRRTFSHFGVVEDVDIKRPKPGTGNAYAFVRYKNLDMAHRAKVELSGQYIGKYQCKIGYGKATPTTKIWVGGLALRTTIAQIEHEFIRFGSIKKIDYDRAECCAYILYDSIDAAITAVKEMRGFPLASAECKLRVDFADIGSYNSHPINSYNDEASTHITPEIRNTAAVSIKETSNNNSNSVLDTSDTLPNVTTYDARSVNNRIINENKFNNETTYRVVKNLNNVKSDENTHTDTYPNTNRDRSKSLSSSSSIQSASYDDDCSSEASSIANDKSKDDSCQVSESSSSDDNFENEDDRETETRDERCIRSRSKSSSSDSSNLKELSEQEIITTARTFNDFVRRAEVLWEGAVMLKYTLYPGRLFLIDGNKELSKNITLHGPDTPYELIRISQRIKLTSEKLEFITNNMRTARHFAIFLCLPNPRGPFHLLQRYYIPPTKHLSELITYLKQKNSVGIMSLLGRDLTQCGMLYAVPSCPFSNELLKRKAPALTAATYDEDHLLFIVLKKELAAPTASDIF